MIRVVAAAYATSHPAGAGDETIGGFDLSTFDPRANELPELLLSAVVRSWSRVHGLVALEAFGHLAWSGTDVEALLRTEVRSMVVEFTRPAGTAT
jgi:hypothetical protein